MFDLFGSNYEFQIKVEKSYFEKYNEQLEFNIEKQSICCNTQAKLFDIINCKLHGIQRKIYLESHILFLVYQTQKNNLIFNLNCGGCAIINKPIEAAKIQKAKLYILENIQNIITIPIVAEYVGTNQCYLKKGFKEIFNQTIFEFIQENRMIKAKHLLQESQTSIADVAQSVGYSSTSSFSQSYKNYFGISPIDHKK